MNHCPFPRSKPSFRLALLALACCALPALRADSLTFTPSADVTAKQASPTQNFGMETAIQTSIQSTHAKQTFLMFSVTGVPVGATGISAALKLSSQTTGTGRTVTAHAVASITWTELGVTWNAKPALGASLSSVSSFTTGSTATWDVSAAVTGNGTFALGLDSTFSGDTTFASREGTPQPQLVVTYTPATIGTLSTSPATGTPGFSSSTWAPPPSSHKNDGRVDAILQAGNVVYIGSDSDQTWQGSTMRTDMPHLVAYNLTTGALITTWKPAPNGRIYDIKLSADGTKLWVAGEFTSICGTSQKEVAILQALTGTGDTSAATLLQSQLNLTPAGGDGTIRSIVLDEANNRAWLGGSFTTINGSASAGVTKLSWSGTSWNYDSGFNPGTTIDIADGESETFGFVRSMLLKGDGTKLVVAGSFVWTGSGTSHNGQMAAFDPNTGAAATWGFKFTYASGAGEQPGMFDLAGDANCVYVSGGHNAGNMTVCLDWNGSGPNTLTPNSGDTPATFLGNWYYGSDGNNQCMTLGVIDGVTCVISGTHGDNVASLKNKNDANSGSKIPCGKMYAVSAGATGGVLQSYSTPVPPSLSSPDSSGAPLGPWAFYYNAATGTLHIGGDFTAVNGSAANTFRRYARFDAH